MAIEAGITVYRGSASTLKFTMDPVVNITGWTIGFTVATAKNIDTKLLTIVGSVTDAPNGVFTVALTAAQTDIAPGSYVWDVWRTNAGSEHVLGFGVFTVLPSVRFPEAV